jgi:hypothetical protein
MLSSTRSIIHRLGRGAPGLAALVLAAAIAEAAPAAADLQPTPITVLQSKPDHARGLIFVAPKTTPAPGLQQGPEIVDELGRPVWFQAVPDGEQATDFRVQSYRGADVLTWWHGQSQPGHGQGAGVIVDRSYQVLATVKAGNDLAADLHEFRLTPRGTALITIYHQVPRDLSPVGGPADGAVFEGVVQEIDVASGRVLFEWHSLDHVGLDESQAPVPTTAGAVYDYFHVNAVSLDVDGDLLVDARNTWTFYKIDRRSGEILSRVGGKKTDFTLGPGAAFAWQHDPEAVDRHTVRVFDNEAAPTILPRSRVIWLRRDPWTHTVSLVRAFEHPDGLSAGSQGNSQALDGGHTFVGWGATGRFSELDPFGNLVFDASVPTGYDTYRAYRHVWHGRPDVPPTATAQRTSEDAVTVHAIWNGATDVARWIVVAGGHPHALWPVASADWNGLDTTIAVSTRAAEVAVVAVDEAGRELGRSPPVAVAP